MNPIIGEPLKGKKKVFTERDLFEADIATFGSKIGRITNLATSMCSIRGDFSQKGNEYRIITDRLKSCCKHQSNQIDKAKAGIRVKDIQRPWTQFQHIDGDDEEDLKNKKQINNNILVDKHPYFFKYVYQNERIKYNRYFTSKDKVCRLRFKVPLRDLLKMSKHTREQREFLDAFYKYNKFINSNCEMNRLCKYIESIDFEIRKKISDHSDFDHSVLIGDWENSFDEEKISKK